MTNEHRKKLDDFLLDPSKERLFTLEEYEKMDAFDKGYVHYLQAAWVESELSDGDNPFDKGVKEHEEFNNGQLQAMQKIQDD